jgi:hypothetical protein
MENLLQGIVSGHKETQKKLDEQTVVLNKILDIESDRADIEKKQLNAEKRAARQSKKDKSDKGLKALLKKDKDDKKDKKSFLSSLLGLLGKGLEGLLEKLFAPLTNMLAPLKGLGAKLAKTFASSLKGVLSSPGFWKGAGLAAAVATVIAAIDKGVKEQKSGNDRYIKEQEAKAGRKFTPEEKVKSLTDRTARQAAAGGAAVLPGVQTMLTEQQASKIPSAAEAIIKNLQKTRGKGVFGTTQAIPGELASETGVAKDLAVAARNVIAHNDELYKMTKRLEKINDPKEKKELKKLIETQTNTLKAWKEKEEAAAKAYDEAVGMPIQKRQKGGHINVPGQGSGDKVPMMLPSGSFVMNRNAAAMLQQGGMVPTLLEPGEKVFGPGQWGPMEKMMNTTFGRFQKGGELEGGFKFDAAGNLLTYKGGKWVLDTPGAEQKPQTSGAEQKPQTSGLPDASRYLKGDWLSADKAPESKTGTGRDGKEDKPGNATHEYLTKLNDANIKKVSSAPGKCVTGSLETMQASGVPNPKATGRDAGNNPRGMLVQTMNTYGWKSMGEGTATTLNSPYGNANVNVMNRDQWLGQVAAGKIPSGALIFQTEHSDWNGTSAGSSGYDAAIAQKNGGALWNGQSLGNLVYGNTQKVVALTPDGKDGHGVPGEVNQTPNSKPAGFLGLAGFAADITKAFLKVFDPDGMLNMQGLSGMFGAGAGGGNKVSTDVTGDITASSEPLTGDQASKAKEMLAYIEEKGYSTAQARGLVANAIRESSLNPKEMSGDDGGYGGLFQWKGDRQTAKVQELVKSGNWKGQIDYALQEDAGPRYLSETAGMNAHQAADWWDRKWERSENAAHSSMRHGQILQGFQTGGNVSNLRGASNSSNVAMVSKSQEMFAQKIAEAVTPIVIPMPSGGGGGAQVVNQPTDDGHIPDLPSADSSIMAMEYKYRITMGASV